MAWKTIFHMERIISEIITSEIIIPEVHMRGSHIKMDITEVIKEDASLS